MRVTVVFKSNAVLAGILLLVSQPAVASLPFPAQSLPGTQLGSNWPPDFEPSGAVWHSGLEQLLVAFDNGYVASIDQDGSNLTRWHVAGDLEGITVADPNSPFVYVGLENPDSILELNLHTGEVTRTFDLTPWMTGPHNLGLEAVTFVPDSNNLEGGLFYAGLQNDGKIYSFRLPIVSSSSATTVTYLSVFTPQSGRTDISGLHYDQSNEVLYAVFDTSSRLRAMEADGKFLSEWTLAGRNQEGIALTGDQLFIAEDSGEVWRYGSFPFLTTPSTVDFNNDGTVDAADYTLWQDNLGDTTVQADYLLWNEAYGSVVTAASSNARVPEPTTVMPVLLALFAMPLRRTG